ncbi:hypothetical protein KC345_g11206 [Hortaea werneckii]|nr:hypothetical protein KC345_g11206 [Hortaea werneckii]
MHITQGQHSPDLNRKTGQISGPFQLRFLLFNQSLYRRFRVPPEDMKIGGQLLLQAVLAFQVIEAGIHRNLHNPGLKIINVLPLAAEYGDKHLLAQILGIGSIVHHIIAGPVYLLAGYLNLLLTHAYIVLHLIESGRNSANFFSDSLDTVTHLRDLILHHSGQLSYFFGYDIESPAEFPGMRRFNCRIKRKEMGLRGNIADRLDNAMNGTGLLLQIEQGFCILR